MLETAQKYGISVPTLQRYLKNVPQNQDISCRIHPIAITLQMDATYWGRNFGVDRKEDVPIWHTLIKLYTALLIDFLHKPNDVEANVYLKISGQCIENNSCLFNHNLLSVYDVNTIR